MALRKLIANPKPQAAIVACAYKFVNVFQAIVTSIAPLLAHSYPAKRKSKVVTDYKKILQGNILLLHPVSYGIAAKIHIGGGFEQKEFLPAERVLCNRAVTFCRKKGVGALYQGIQHHKSHIVAGIVVLVAYISKACNKIIHTAKIRLLILLCSCCSCLACSHNCAEDEALRSYHL